MIDHARSGGRAIENRTYGAMEECAIENRTHGAMGECAIENRTDGGALHSQLTIDH